MPASIVEPASDSGTRSGGNLPSVLTDFVGRRHEASEVKRLLSGSRLVTLTGVGGVGKTRLALHVAAGVRRAFPDGTWFVDLTELQDSDLGPQQRQDPELLAQMVSGVLRLPVQPGRQQLDHLREALVRRRMLLILDSCEHLLVSCALLAEAVLRSCPDVTVVATSREPLLIAGEFTFPVPPLAVPDARHHPVPVPAALAQVDSVALFVTRTTAVMPHFQLTVGNQAAVSAICRRLDGIPLAIELAAARIRVLSPAQIVDRLADPFAALGRGPRTVPERQQTLWACLKWSYDLCSAPEQRLWQRLAVFAGGTELDAVEGVCTDDDLPVRDMLDLVAALLEKSILVKADEGGVARYRMLDTIRDFGMGELRASGREATVRQRHRDWYLQLAARAQREWISVRQAYWQARLGREHANMRVAMEYCLAEPGGAEAALWIAVAMPAMHWIANGLFREGRNLLNRGLAKSTDPTPVRAHALLLAGHLAIAQGDHGPGAELLNRGEALARELDSPAELAYAVYLRGVTDMFGAGNIPAAIDHFERALAAFQRVPDQSPPLRLDLLLTLGFCVGLLGDRERATALEDEVRRITSPWDTGYYQARAAWGRTLAALRQGELDTAATLVSERLHRVRTQAPDDRYGTTLAVEVLAWIAAAADQPARAAALLGAADSLWAELGGSVAGHQHLKDGRRECERRSREALPEDAFGTAFERGRGFAPEQVLSYALDAESGPPEKVAADGATDVLALLSRREREVADLVAHGLTNKDIAGRLVISQRTVESHVEHILTKLGFRSRSQVAAWLSGTRRQAD